jgi:hypothetical protein
MLRHRPGATKNSSGRVGMTTDQNANSPPAGRTIAPTAMARYAPILATRIGHHAQIGTRRRACR